MFSYGFQGILPVNPIVPLRPFINVWYDGAMNSTQLFDRSGNNRHARITSDLISNSRAILGSAFINNGGTAVAPTSNTSLNASPPSGFAGQFYSNVQWNIATGFGLARTENFVSINGETQEYRFWYRRNTNTLINWGLRAGNGATAIASGTLNAAVGTWTQVTGTAVVSSSGGLAHLFVNVGTGTHSIDIFFPDNQGVTVVDQPNICFVLPVDATLSATDRKKTFYSATTNFPLTTRGLWQYNGTVPRIRCGGAFRYIFLKTGLTTNQQLTTNKILVDNFLDRDFAFRSCPLVTPITTTIQAAITSARSGDFRDRTRITYNTNQNVTSYSDFTYVSGGGFKTYIATFKPGMYIEGLNGAVINVTKPLNSTDTELLFSQVIDIINECGFKNVIVRKEFGGYVAHIDASSLVGDNVIILNSDIEELGSDAIFAWRLANSLPLPAQQLAFNTIAGGGHNDLFLEVENTRLSGMRAFTWQDVACTAGNGGIYYYDYCTLESKPLYDAISNPLSLVLEVIRTASSGGSRNTQIFMINTTRNSTINQVGADRSIFINEA